MISRVLIGVVVEFSPVKKDCFEQLRKLLLKFMENIIAMQTLGHDTVSSDYF